MKGKVVVITGAGRGLGEWMSNGFAEAGSHVVVTSENMAECQAVAKKIQDNNGSAIAHRMDVTHLENISETLTRVLDKYGKVDILINNAGYVGKRKTLEVDEPFFDNMNDVNVKGAFFTAQIFGKQMINQKEGKIINIASAAGKLIRKGLANPIYNMNKGAIIMMTKALAEDWAKHNIHVNAIGPGYFETDPVKKRLENQDVYNSVVASTPLGRIGQDTDIVGIAKFLASSESDFITGQTIFVDGGRTIL